MYDESIKLVWQEEKIIYLSFNERKSLRRSWFLDGNLWVTNKIK